MASQWPAAGPLEITIAPRVDYRTYGQPEAVDYRTWSAMNYDMPREAYQRDPMNPYAPPAGGETYWSPEQGQTTTDRVAGAVAMMPIGMAVNAWDAFKAPGRAYQEGMTQDEMIQRSADLAGILGLGGAGWAKAAGGANELGIFGGRLAKTADHAALAKAEKMAADGVDPTTIWNDTGWFRGADQKWRFEIPDDAAKFMGRRSDLGIYAMDKPVDGYPFPKTVVGERPILSHPELVAAYPDQTGIGLSQPKSVTDSTTRGAYSPARFDVVSGDIPEKISLYPDNAEAPKGTLLHELQHATQGREDFARGGNISMFYPDKAAADEMIGTVNDNLRQIARQMDAARKSGDTASLGELKARYDSLMNYKETDLIPRAMADPVDQYKRLAGETEARNVQTRMDMTPEQRRASPPWETQDIPYDQQIVRYGDGGPQMSVEPPPGIKAYHGTNKEFDGFAAGKPIWAAADRGLADEYAKMRWLHEGGDRRTMTVDMKVKNPVKFDFDMNDRISLSDFAARTGIDLGEDVIEDLGGVHRFRVHELVNTPEFLDKATKAGFDGIEALEGGKKTIAAFDPGVVEILKKYGVPGLIAAGMGEEVAKGVAKQYGLPEGTEVY